MSEDWQNDYDWGINRKLIHKEKEQGLIAVDQAFSKAPMRRLYELAIKLSKGNKDLTEDIQDCINSASNVWYDPIYTNNNIFDELNKLSDTYYFRVLFNPDMTEDTVYIAFKRSYATSTYDTCERYCEHLEHLFFDELELF